MKTRGRSVSLHLYYKWGPENYDPERKRRSYRINQRVRGKSCTLHTPGRPRNASHYATFALHHLHNTLAGQPGAILVGRCHNVSLWLRIVGHRLYAKDLAHLVHGVSLLAVHHGEGVAPRTLLALLGQLDQFGELIVQHLDEARVLLQPVLQVIRVFSVQLRAQTRIADLQADSHAPVPLQDSATIIAFDLLGCGPLDGRKNILQPRAAAATLHVLQERVPV